MTTLHTLHNLTQQQCAPRQQALSEAEAASLLALLPDWQLQDGMLSRAFRFKNYYQTMAFVNALAYMTHAQDHHPELIITYQSCTARYTTHSVNQGAGGLSANDFICAARADVIYQNGQGAA